eukprot:764171-Hanusia_phi.AAC.10
MGCTGWGRRRWWSWWGGTYKVGGCSENETRQGGQGRQGRQVERLAVRMGAKVHKRCRSER